MAGGGLVKATGDGYDRLGSPTILDDYYIRLQLEQLWNADRCPALSRERRVEMIAETSRMLAGGPAHVEH